MPTSIHLIMHFTKKEKKKNPFPYLKKAILTKTTAVTPSLLLFWWGVIFILFYFWGLGSVPELHFPLPWKSWTLNQCLSDSSVCPQLPRACSPNTLKSCLRSWLAICSSNVPRDDTIALSYKDISENIDVINFIQKQHFLWSIIDSIIESSNDIVGHLGGIMERRQTGWNCDSCLQVKSEIETFPNSCNTICNRSRMQHLPAP